MNVACYHWVCKHFGEHVIITSGMCNVFRRKRFLYVWCNIYGFIHDFMSAHGLQTHTDFFLWNSGISYFVESVSISSLVDDFCQLSNVSIPFAFPKNGKRQNWQSTETYSLRRLLSVNVNNQYMHNISEKETSCQTSKTTLVCHMKNIFLHTHSLAHTKSFLQLVRLMASMPKVFFGITVFDLHSFQKAWRWLLTRYHPFLHFSDFFVLTSRQRGLARIGMHLQQ